MNIFGFKSGHSNNSKNCKVFFISPKCFPVFCCTFGTLPFEKSSNTEIFLEKMEKNFQITLLLKWLLLEPKMFTVHCVHKLLGTVKGGAFSISRTLNFSKWRLWFTMVKEGACQAKLRQFMGEFKLELAHLKVDTIFAYFRGWHHNILFPWQAVIFFLRK